MLSILFSIVFATSSAHAFLENAQTPVCLEGPEELSIDNSRVLRFKVEQKNQFLARAYVEGKVISLPEQQGDHDHFSISLGNKSTDTLEVIYNNAFGSMPNVQIGDVVTVCGDFINSFARAGGYDASPDGAIIHWVHYNPGNRSRAHEHGFIQFGTDLVGFDDAPAKAWDGVVGFGSSKSRKSTKRR